MKSIENGSRTRRTTAYISVAVLGISIIGACGSSSPNSASNPATTSDSHTSQQQSGSSPIDAGSWPDYYPPNYNDIITASKAEDGHLLFYAGKADEVWQPLIDAFKAKYPWVTNVQSQYLTSDVVYQRAKSEAATGSVKADLLITPDGAGWANYVADNRKLILPYDSPELEKVGDPDFVEPLPNVYTFSIAPGVVAWNTALVPSGISSVHQLAQMIGDDPSKYDGKITTYTIKNGYGASLYHGLFEENPSEWEDFKTIIPALRPESSSGTMVSKIVSGEYAAGLNISADWIFPTTEKGGGLIKYAYPSDGTVVTRNAVAIVAGTTRPATAKLFLDFMLSEPGQVAIGKTLFSIRPGVKTDGGHAYQEVLDSVSKDKIFPTPMKEVSEAEMTSFQERWNSLVG